MPSSLVTELLIAMKRLHELSLASTASLSRVTISEK